jgi:sulfoxide reductase heme-binding subunit YedZ
MTRQNVLRWVLKPLLFLVALGPVAYLTWAALTGHLSANPISDITLETGTWALRFLVITLAITPLRRLTHWNELIKFRRMLGLFAFFYGTLHFITYLWLDQFFDFSGIAKDIWKRPFITVGFTAFMAMLPLAITSTAGWIRRLGGKNWQRLHRLIYIAAVCGVIHYWWLVKSDVQRPMIYGMIFGVLLGYRLVMAIRRRAPRPAVASRSSDGLLRRPS